MSHQLHPIGPRRSRGASFCTAITIVALLSLLGLGQGGLTHAQDATPAAGALAGHPIVGAWVVTDPAGSPSVSVFTADGGMVDTLMNAGAGTGVGAWRPTGARTAAFTFVAPVSAPGFTGTVVIRAVDEVNAAGDAFTGVGTFTIVGADGRVVRSGPAKVTGRRLTVEPATSGGAPLAGFPTWTPPPAGGAPATPAS